MVADLAAFDRLAHLAYIPLPGGEQAVRQPWRVAAAYLAQAFGDDFLNVDIPFVQRLDRAKWRALAQMMARNLNCPPASSLGRLFDAVAALLGLRDEVLYEGQAAVELEALAHPGQQDAASPYPFLIEERGEQAPALLDVRPAIRAIVVDMQRGVAAHEIAVRFHCTVAELLATACLNARGRTGLDMVALSGGVFQNRLLLEYILKRLKAMSFQVYINQRVPPNDGGLALGQFAVAAARLRNM
jgi:hydrogenase maturation protein HypF